MKCKVRLTCSVEMVVEGESEDAILEWLNVTSPGDVINSSIPCNTDYSEEILETLLDSADADYVIESN